MKDEFHTKIVGVTKENEDGEKIQALLKDISECSYEEELLSLEHESDNPYDENAIKVYYGLDHIGYINRELAAELAPLVDQQRVVAHLSEITGGEDGKSFGCNISIRTVPEGETVYTDSRRFYKSGKVSPVSTPSQGSKPAAPSQSTQQTNGPKESFFDGTILQHFGYSLLAGIFIALTLGIGTPWAYCGLHRWVAEHTVIDSKRLEFDGKGLQLFILVLKLAVLPFLILIGVALIFRLFSETSVGTFFAILAFLVLLTVSIFYGSFASIQINKWIACHTHSHEVQWDHAQAAPQQKEKRDWVDIVEPILPLVCIVEFCAVFFGIVFLVEHFFD